MEQDNAEISGGGFAPTPMTDILTPRADKPEPAPTPRTEAKPEPASAQEASGDKPAIPKDDRPRDATGKFAPKDAQEAAPPAAKQDAPQSVPVQAVQEERRKRQALERELAELRARAAHPVAPQQQPQPAQVPLPDLMFQDPERFVQALAQRQEEALLQTRIATSEAIARQQPDYDAAEQALTAYAQSSPQAAREVADALRQHPAPAMWAYQAGRHLLSQQRWAPVMQQHGDPEAFINAEVERRMADRMRTQPAPAPSAAPLPQSLASARSAGPRNIAPGFSGPTPMSAILGRR
jgi:hypothetical protein